MKKIISLVISLMLILTSLVACQHDNGTDTATGSNPTAEMQDTARPDGNQGRLSIVTTIFPQYDFVRQIVGDKADVTMLLKPGAESHSYEPTPQDIKTIQDSNLFIYTGGENDTWVESILKSTDGQGPKTMRLVDLVDTVSEEVVEGMEHDHDHDHDDDHDHDHDDDHDHDHDHELDEHVWTSPVKAIEIVEKITDEIADLDPANAEVYRANSEKYVNDLKKLDADFREVVANGKRDVILFADRFPFRYLADEYGLKYYAAFTGCSTDTEASAATVAFLIDKTKELGLPVVFTIELSNEKIADSIVEATGVKKLTLHSIHNLSVEDLEAGASYLSLMEKNVENLKVALQ